MSLERPPRAAAPLLWLARAPAERPSADLQLGPDHPGSLQPARQRPHEDSRGGAESETNLEHIVAGIDPLEAERDQLGIRLPRPPARGAQDIVRAVHRSTVAMASAAA